MKYRKKYFLSMLTVNKMTTYGTEKISSVNINRKLPQYVLIGIVTLEAFCSGINYGWPSPSLPKLMSDEYALNVTAEDGSYITTISSLGNIIAYLIWPTLIDLIGRKISILFIPLLSVISLVLIYFSSSFSIILLYAARVIGGIAQGASYSAMRVYICEVSVPEIRGTFFCCTSVIWCCGILFINIVGSVCTIETMSLISLIFPILFFVTFTFAPETPYYNLMKNEKEKARHSLKKLRWNADIEEEFLDMENYMIKQMTKKARYQDLFLNKINRKPLLLGNTTSLTEIFTGMASLTFYAQIFFAQATDVITEEWAASLMIVIKLIFFIISVFIVDIIGRKPLLLLSIGGCFFMLSFLSIFFFLKDYSNIISDDLSWIPLVIMIFFTIFYNLGIGNISMWILGELLPTNIRTKGICVDNILYSVSIFAVTKLYQSLTDNYSVGFPLVIFAVAQIIGFGVCWRYMPETKGKTFEEIHKELE